MTDSEQSAVRDARTGEPEAWDALFRRYQLPLYAYVFELLHDEQASLDTVQEAFINAARHLNSLRDDSKFGSWLFGIAHQKVAQRWRRRVPEPVPLADLESGLADESDDPCDGLIRREQEAEFMNALKQLSPDHRAVLLLHVLEGFPLDDIAHITGKAVGTVKSRIHYARKSLRHLLENPS